jgi:hypothetical protein
MNLRELWKKIDLKLRPPHLEGGQPVDNLDGAVTLTGGGHAGDGSDVPAPAPVNWVPSQQDDRPRH